MIDTPGIYIVEESEYHADPCPTPSLSSTIARILIQQSPLHAWAAHPRLGNLADKEESAHMDIGSIAHALILEGEDRAVVIEADNYRTKVAQEQRDEARAKGKYPILAKEMQDVKDMIQIVRVQLDNHEDASDAFKDGQPEMTLAWQEPNGVWCRVRPDWMCNGIVERMYDLKTSGRSARPANLSRVAASLGWPIQASLYCRGFKAVTKLDVAEFRFVCVENYKPYALSVLELSPADMALADAQVETAIDTFGQCLESGVWPGYSQKVERIESPPWVENAWMSENYDK